MLPETPIVERLGGQVRVLDYLSDHSTTAIVTRIRATPAAGAATDHARPRDGSAGPGRCAAAVAPRSTCSSRPATGPVELATTLAGLAAQEHPFDVRDQRPVRRAAVVATPPARDDAAGAARGRAPGARRWCTRRGTGSPSTGPRCWPARRRRYALFLDDDIWLEPGTLARLHEAIASCGCGLVGAAMQGVSFLDDRRPAQLRAVRAVGGPAGARADRARHPAWDRWMLHNAANPMHLAQQHVRPGERWVPYKIAWVAGCVLFDRAALDAVGGFDFWPELPAAHCGEDVVAQRRVMAPVRRGGDPAVGGVPPRVADDGAGPGAQRERPARRPGGR